MKPTTQIESELLSKLQELVDRMEIEKCILRVARGMDRHDAALAKSGFHQDARDDHAMFIGSAADAIDWMELEHSQVLRGHQHYVTNMSIEIDGDVAHVESYNIMAGVAADSWTAITGGGRYNDRLEKRDGVWGIVDRISTAEWWAQAEWMEFLSTVVHPYSQDSNDISYVRPLRVDRPDGEVTMPSETRESR